MVEFSIFNVPLERRLQTLAALWWLVSTPPFALFFSMIFTVLICMVPFVGLPLCVLYYFWVFFKDDTPARGGRPIKWLQRWVVWKYFAAFFPATLVKTVDLDPKKRYIFGYHPHGILSIGAFLAFCTDALDYSKLFPGIDLRILTLKMNFMWPFHREYMQAMGTCDVSESSCLHNLCGSQEKSNGRKPNQIAGGPGTNSILIVVGGAQEALDTHAGTSDLTLKKRRGFIRVALQTGAELVPVFCFGENSTFYCTPNPEGGWLRSFQEKSLRFLGFSMPIFHGRGMFNKNLGLLPFRVPLTVVVGKPVPVTRIENPTQDDINKHHALYVEALQALYDENKDKYDKEREYEMRLVR